MPNRDPLENNSYDPLDDPEQQQFYPADGSKGMRPDPRAKMTPYQLAKLKYVAAPFDNPPGPSVLDSFTYGVAINTDKIKAFFNSFDEEEHSERFDFRTGKSTPITDVENAELRDLVMQEDELEEITNGISSTGAKIAKSAGSVFNPLNVAAFITIGKVFKGAEGALALGKYAETWINNTAGLNAVRYLGNVARVAGETATFQYLEDRSRQVIGLPVENIGDNAFSAGMYGAGFGALWYGAPYLKKFLKELNSEIIHADRTHNAVIREDGSVKVNHSQGAETLIESASSLEENAPLNSELAAEKVGGNEPLSYSEDTKPTDASIGTGLSTLGIVGGLAVGAAVTTDDVEAIPKIHWKLPNFGPRAKSLAHPNLKVKQAAELYYGNKIEGNLTGSGIATSIIDKREVNKADIALNHLMVDEHLARFKDRELSKNPDLKNKDLENMFQAEYMEGIIEGGVSNDPIINSVVKNQREIFRKYLERGIDVDAFENPQEMMNNEFCPQYHDRNRIKPELDRWVGNLTKGISEENLEYSVDEVREVVDDIIETAYYGKRTPFEGSFPGIGLPSSLKGRKIRINQKYLKDFLVRDPKVVMERFINGVGGRIAEEEVLSRAGVLPAVSSEGKATIQKNYENSLLSISVAKGKIKKLNEGLKKTKAYFRSAISNEHKSLNLEISENKKAAAQIEKINEKIGKKDVDLNNRISSLNELNESFSQHYKEYESLVNEFEPKIKKAEEDFLRLKEEFVKEAKMAEEDFYAYDEAFIWEEEEKGDVKPRKEVIERFKELKDYEKALSRLEKDYASRRSKVESEINKTRKIFESKISKIEKEIQKGSLKRKETERLLAEESVNLQELEEFWSSKIAENRKQYESNLDIRKDIEKDLENSLSELEELKGALSSSIELSKQFKKEYDYAMRPKVRFNELLKQYYDSIGGHATTPEEIRGADLIRAMPLVVSGQMDSMARKALEQSFGGTWITGLLDAFQHMNVASLLGGLGLSAIEDISVNAAKGTLGQHIETIIEMGGYEKIINSLKGQELLRLGFGLDRILDNVRTLSSVNVMEDLGALADDYVSRFAEKVTKPLSHKVINASGIRVIDAIREFASASMILDDIAERILAGEKKVGILEGEIVGRIKKQIRDHMTHTDDGTALYNTELWTDIDARDDFIAEARRRVRQEVIKADKADIPDFFRTPIGKLFSLFQNFSFALTNQVLYPMIKGGHYGEVASLVTFSMGFGMLREMVSSRLRNDFYDGKDQDKERVRFFKNVLRRTQLGLLNTPLEIIYDGVFGETRIKNANDIVASALRGGNLKYAMDFWDAGTGILRKRLKDEDLTQQNIRRLIKCMPLQNAPYVAPLWNYFVVPQFKEK
jgi:hypothetical protein